MKNKVKLVAIVVIVLVIGIAIFNRQESPKGPIKLGVATLLSGDFAALGDNIVKSTKIAVEEINATGGINGRPLEIVVEDSGVDSKTGLSAIQKLVNVDGVRYIVGGMSSNGTIAAASVANQKYAIIMTPVTGGRNVDMAGDYIFRTANSDVLAGRDLANAMIKLGYTKVGVVAEVTEYTLDVKKIFEQTMQSAGGAIVVSEEFQPNTKDYRTMISKVRSTKPQALLVLSQLGTNAAQFIKQSRELGFNPPLFTDFTFAMNGDAKKIVGSFDGIYFADPSYGVNDVATQKFFEKYKSTYKSDPVIPFHSVASYDSVMMFAKALRVEGDNSSEVKDWLLSNIKNYKGLMGTYSLDKDGNSDLGFTVKVIKNGKPENI